MAITIVDQFPLDLLTGKHDFSADTFKLALFAEAAALDGDTTAYSATNEVSGTGYTAGGATAAVSSGYPQYVTINGVAYASIRFDTVTWSTATISGIRYGLLYNDTATGNPAIAVFDYAADQSVSSGNATIAFPSAERPPIAIRIG